MTYKHVENKLALVWFSEELRKYEQQGKSHARIVVEIVDGKAQKRESTEKGLFQIN